MIFSQKIKNILVSFLILFFLVISVQAVLADVSYGLDDSAKQSGLYAEDTDISKNIGSIIGAVLSFIGILFFILMVYAGFLWMTARGNEEQVAKSISIMMQASIGLIIVAGAYLITKFVGETVIDAFLPTE